MIKKLIPVILFLLDFLFLQSAFGQVQINMPDYIRQRFQSYCESVPREEIFVHTDREEYIAGEDLWFNIYLIDRQSFNTSLNSKIAYFELLNPENRPVVQKRIRIDKGFGPGQIVLPDSLGNGTYLIRVYTNWMKNFLPYNCFMKDIKIYNAFNIKTFKGRANTMDVLRGETEVSADTSDTNPELTLKVNNSKPDILEIFVNADENFRSVNSNLFYLFIQTHGIINHISSEKITGENSKISIPKTSLTSGINQITIFDSKGKPICERFIYTPSGNQKQILSLHSIDSCKTRSKISLEFDIDNKLSKTPNPTNLSISIAPQINISGGIELNDYLVFGTEFGLFPLRTIKSQKINEIPPEEMDILLSKVKSNWINWKTILSDDLLSFKYQVEKEDHFLLGQLLTRDQQLANPGEYLLMSTPGKDAIFQYAITNYEANFNFSINIDEEVKDLIIQPDDTIKKNKIYIESSFPDQYLSSEISVDSISKQVPSYISKWSVNYQISLIYESSSVGALLNPVIPPPKPKRFYGKPDVEIIMKDYIKLPEMEEVFFELIPHVTLKNNNSVYEISFVDLFGNKIYEVAPVLLIDGVIIKDPSIIAKLDPELVEKIDVKREIYNIGDCKFYGIVNIITKAGDYSSVTLPDYSIRLLYRVTDPVREFVSPDYSSTEMRGNRNPDFRNTLYWNPSIKPDKEGKARIEFWTSDLTSDYEINIHGITSEGNTVSLRKIIKVK